MKQYEAVMKSVSDPTRVRILKILEGGEICVCQITVSDAEMREAGGPVRLFSTDHPPYRRATGTS